MASNTNRDGGGGTAAFLRSIKEEYEKTVAIRQYIHEQETVSHRDKRALASRARTYYDVLRGYKNDSKKAKEYWESENVDIIKELDTSVVSVQTDTPGDSPNAATSQMNALAAQDPEYILSLIDKLDDFLHVIGASFPVENDTHNDSPTHDHLRTLAEMRGQEESLEKIPEGN